MSKFDNILKYSDYNNKQLMDDLYDINQYMYEKASCKTVLKVKTRGPKVINGHLNQWVSFPNM